METVTIGCRIPNGLTLEVGYTTTVQGSGGAPYVRYRKNADYQEFTLKGSGQGLILRDAMGKPLTATPLPGKRDLPPYINHGVPADLWARWCKEHADSPLLTGGQLFVVPKPADAAAVAKDAKAMSPALFQPLDPSVPFNDQTSVIEKRKDDAD